MEFSRQEDWSRYAIRFSGDLPDPGIEPGSPALQGGSLLSEPPGKPISEVRGCQSFSSESISVVADGSN